MVYFKKRSQEKEIMDLQEFDEQTLLGIHAQLRKVNRWLGGSRAVIHHLEAFSQKWKTDETIRILDVGSSAADIPLDILKWAKKRQFKIEITALDLNPNAASLHNKIYGQTGIRWIVARNPQLPFAPGSFDYVISSMFFHHQDEEDILLSLPAFDRVARRGIIINDLLRKKPAYFWFGVFSALFARNAIFYNDGLLSVKRGFHPEEIRGWAKSTKLSYLKCHPHLISRFALAGEKYGV